MNPVHQYNASERRRSMHYLMRLLKIVVCAFIAITLQSCGVSNALYYHYAMPLWSKLIHDDSFTDIKQVKLHKNGDFEICFIGNQLKENSQHRLYLAKNIYTSNGFGVPRDRSSKSSTFNPDEKIEVSNFLSLGCDLSLKNGDLSLELSSKNISGFSNLPKMDLMRYYSYKGSNESQLSEITIGFNSLPIRDAQPHTIQWILYVDVKGDFPYIAESDRQYLYLKPRFSAFDELFNGVKKNQNWGTVLDVLTFPVQFPLFVLGFNHGLYPRSGIGAM